MHRKPLIVMICCCILMTTFEGMLLKENVLCLPTKEF